MRIIPAGAERADYGIEARQLCSKICIVHIGFDRLHIRRGENLIRVACKSGDCMTTRGEFTDDGIAYVTGGTNNGKIHGILLKWFYEGALIVSAPKSGENRRFLK